MIAQTQKSKKKFQKKTKIQKKRTPRKISKTFNVGYSSIFMTYYMWTNKFIILYKSLNNYFYVNDYFSSIFFIFFSKFISFRKSCVHPAPYFLHLWLNFKENHYFHEADHDQKNYKTLKLGLLLPSKKKLIFQNFITFKFQFITQNSSDHLQLLAGIHSTSVNFVPL